MFSAPPGSFAVRSSDDLVLKEGENVAMESPPSPPPPMPKVTWEFNKRPLETSRRVTVDAVSAMTSACIGHVTKADEGTYSVTLEEPTWPRHSQHSRHGLRRYARKKVHHLFDIVGMQDLTICFKIFLSVKNNVCFRIVQEKWQNHCKNKLSEKLSKILS